MPTWATRDQARARWADAPTDNDLLDALLATANEELLPFAPAFTGSPPSRYTDAEVLQAKGNYEAGRTVAGDVLGFSESGYAITAKPLSAKVQALLRPRAGVPRIG